MDKKDLGKVRRGRVGVFFYINQARRQVVQRRNEDSA